MPVNPIHGIYLELERAAKARGDKAEAAKWRRAIGINRAATTVRRRIGGSPSFADPAKSRRPSVRATDVRVTGTREDSA